MLVSAAGASAAETARLEGEVRRPLVFDQATLDTLPVTTIEVSYAAASGVVRGSYTGVLLWDVLKKAQLIDAAGVNARLRHTLLVTSRDGYSVALALGEIDPAYGNRKVLLAYQGSDSLTSVEHMRLLVPGDIHSGRAVRDVAVIEVK
ncbi:MAG TPA: hypothetical protein VHA07_02445 [Devosia sp.]|nr:hypothetical protein [Devosia sp.]